MTAHALMVGDDSTDAESSSWLWTIPCAEPHSSEVSLCRDHAISVDVKFAGVLFDRALTARAVGLAATASDAAIVKAAYQHWGLELFSHLRGSFAMAIADPAQHRRVVARDHLGLQPLFYAIHRNRLFAASSARAVVAAPGVSRDPNRLALADALCRRFPDVEETFYEAVKRLPPASFLLIADNVVRTHRYWNPLDAATPSATSEEEAFERYVALQRQAVSRCAAVGRTAVFLSGGLDSAGVAAAATDACAERGAAPPIALSLTFPGSSCDEAPLQTSVARALDLPHSLLTFEAAVGARSLMSQSIELNRHISSPLLNYWRPAYMQLARRGRDQGARVVLSGEGGDEWTVPSAYVAADLISRGRLLALRGFLQAWNRAEESTGLLWHRGLRPLTGRLIASLAPRAWDARRARRLADGDPDWIAPDAQLRRAQRQRAVKGLGPARPLRGFAAVDFEQSLSSSVAQQVLEESFAQGERLGMRFLHPYHDADFVAFFCQLPANLSNAGGWVRGLSRRQLARRFPALGFDRQRKVLANTFHATTMEQGRSALTARDLELPLLHELGIVHAARAREYVRVPGRVVARRAWQLTHTEAWLRAHIDT